MFCEIEMRNNVFLDRYIVNSKHNFPEKEDCVFQYKYVRNVDCEIFGFA